MKSRKRLSAWILSLALVTTVTACSSSAPEGDSAAAGGTSKEVKITLLNSKGEIQQQLEEAAKAFKTDHPDIAMEIIPVPAGQSPFEKASALYASGNPATITMLDPSDVIKFKDRIADLSGEKWKADAVDKSLDGSTLDGKVMAFPLAIEGFGLIYNKAVLDKAAGGSFDPSSVKTRQDLEKLMGQVKASGTAPLVISPMDWSLGAHYLSLAYSAQSPDTAKVAAWIEELKAGKGDLANNKVFGGLMDTFDLLMKNNIDEASALSGTYERGPELLGKGEVGLWFMGNWAWPQIQSFDTAGGQYGFLPVPLSDNPEDFGNSQIAAAVSKRLVLDKEKSTPEQLAAAKTFLNWMVYEEKGQDFLVNKASLIPAFKNIKLEPQDPLAKSIKDYIARGKTQEAMGTLPADHWAKNGAAMQKYLSKTGDRAELIKDIESYWKSVK
ncbi:raffinose/stachyose/melibiose transport system substrate-binding protein [Paenibacillus mucilaginosus]|uniref:ABC transporter substrate-binding protein n=1 Tax=Paenibacillus mucilaginosus TaxID=61624 RepID=UPI003D25F4A5